MFLRGIGVNIREVWGMTETSGAASIQPDWGDCDGRVGFFPDEMEAKVAEDGELLVKGPIVFKGYFKNDKATADTLWTAGCIPETWPKRCLMAPFPSWTERRTS